MRDILVVTIFAVWVVYALRRPFLGVLLYFWISVMNPHRYSWGFAYHLPLAMVAAVATLVSMALHWEEVRFPRVWQTYLFLALWAYVTLTTIFAFYPENAWVQWSTVSKIFLMTLVAMCVMTTRKRLFWFVLTLVVYVGLIGVKGAIFGILTEGRYRIWGPSESFLADNNSLGLAMVMILPLSLFSQELLRKSWQRFALLMLALAVVVSTVLTYSRGAFLGLAAVGFLYGLLARHKVRVSLALGLVVLIGLSLAPEAWFQRMSTIKEGGEESSAAMRLNSWSMAANLAAHNPLGGGFDCFTPEQYYRYAPNPELGLLGNGRASTAHSIFFEVLAMHGYPGLFLYLACIVSILRMLWMLDRKARRREGAEWIVAYTRGFTVSIAGFLVSGAFLSRAFFDLFWAIYAAAICFRPLAEAALEVLAPERPTRGAPDVSVEA